MRWAALAALALVLIGAAPPPTAIDRARWVLAPELSSAIYSEAAGNNGEAFRAFGVGLSATRLWTRWGLGLNAEALVWRTEDFLDETDLHVALLTGPHGELRYARGLIRFRLAAGLAVLLEGTEDDESGQLGFYGDVRPVGFRWPLGWSTLGFDPLSLMVVVPAAGGIPIVDVQYRSTVYLEFGR